MLEVLELCWVSVGLNGSIYCHVPSSVVPILGSSQSLSSFVGCTRQLEGRRANTPHLLPGSGLTCCSDG